MKIPLEAKVFAGYLRKGQVILTKDNLVKRNRIEVKCVFCYRDETIKHLFFRCKFARSI
jgi:hypothetical protein